MRHLLPILAFLSSAPALAQETMSAEEFDAYTQGKTLYYHAGGAVYGAERYLNGRRVVWSFLDGECKDGIWYEQDGQICFAYEDNTGPQCWTFSRSAGGLVARFMGESGVSELYEAQDIGEEMLCLGPKVGV